MKTQLKVWWAVLRSEYDKTAVVTFENGHRAEYDARLQAEQALYAIGYHSVSVSITSAAHLSFWTKYVEVPITG
jgi:hypothetical protein